MRSLSKFPLGTVIEIDNEEYIKADRGIYGPWWEPINCEDCQGVLGKALSEVDALDDARVKIISVPYVIVHMMALMLCEEYGDTDAEGEPITVGSVIEDAMTQLDEHLHIATILKEKEEARGEAETKS